MNMGANMEGLDLQEALEELEHMRDRLLHEAESLLEMPRNTPTTKRKEREHQAAWKKRKAAALTAACQILQRQLGGDDA